jgi:hypothetical protein
MLSLGANKVLGKYGVNVLHSRVTDEPEYVGPEGRFRNDALNLTVAGGAVACPKPVTGVISQAQLQRLLEVSGGVHA